jgi:hypothetical protein
VLAGVGSGLAPQRQSIGIVAQQPLETRLGRVRVEDRHHHRAGMRNLAGRPDRVGQDRQTVRHRLQVDQTERFVVRKEREQVGVRVPPPQLGIVDLARQ